MSRITKNGVTREMTSEEETELASVRASSEADDNVRLTKKYPDVAWAELSGDAKAQAKVNARATARSNKATNKASAKAKLIAGEALTADEADTIVI